MTKALHHDGTAPGRDTSRAATRQRYWLDRAQALRTALEFVEAAAGVLGGPYEHLHLGCDEWHDLDEVVAALRRDLRDAQHGGPPMPPGYEQQTGAAA